MLDTQSRGPSARLGDRLFGFMNLKRALLAGFVIMATFLAGFLLVWYLNR